MRLEDGRIGTVVKSGHGFFTVEFDDMSPSVTRRKDSLTLVNPGGHAGARDGSSGGRGGRGGRGSAARGGGGSGGESANAAASRSESTKAVPRRQRRQQTHSRLIDLRRKLTQQYLEREKHYGVVNHRVEFSVWKEHWAARCVSQASSGGGGDGSGSKGESILFTR